MLENPESIKVRIGTYNNSLKFEIEGGLFASFLY